MARRGASNLIQPPHGLTATFRQGPLNVASPAATTLSTDWLFRKQTMFETCFRIACVCLLAVAFQRPPDSAGVDLPDGHPQCVEAKYLPNALRLNDKVISGGLPEGETAFQELEELGVKTIISVDGATPDVDLAKKHGMRYVHLPHGYDGITELRVKELAKAVRDLAGPIYIHCHHGKHRSPAAAAAACVANGLLPHERAETFLKTAGTGENYRGLYQTVDRTRRVDDADLDTLKAEFPEIARLPPLAEAMVAIEHTHDHLKALSDHGWKPTPEHPDLDAEHEALLLKEHFTELLRRDEVRARPQRFRELMQEGQAAAEQLETALDRWDGASAGAPKEISGSYKLVSSNCTVCHKEFRDVPLSEKKAR